MPYGRYKLNEFERLALTRLCESKAVSITCGNDSEAEYQKMRIRGILAKHGAGDVVTTSVKENVLYCWVRASFNNIKSINQDVIKVALDDSNSFVRIKESRDVESDISILSTVLSRDVPSPAIQSKMVNFINSRVASGHMTVEQGEEALKKVGAR